MDDEQAYGKLLAIYHKQESRFTKNTWETNSGYGILVQSNARSKERTCIFHPYKDLSDMHEN